MVVIFYATAHSGGKFGHFHELPPKANGYEGNAPLGEWYSKNAEACEADYHKIMLSKERITEAIPADGIAPIAYAIGAAG
jgi:predicted NAD-dependent protein-ADP-ribosyltransferase YbiA (DUF1768 family)